MSSSGGGTVILAQVQGSSDTPKPIGEHAFRQMLQAIRHSHPALYADLAALIGDPTP